MKINELIKKLCTKEVMFYAVFGILTTAVNLTSFYILTSILHIEGNFANLISIIIAVVFAYFTNRKIVFNSQADQFGEYVVEFCRFIIGRLFTMAIEYYGCFILFRYLPIPEFYSKCIITVIVIILNFFISKFFSFRKERES